MTLLVNLGKLDRVGKTTIADLLAPIFNPALTTLADVYGNVAEAISVAGRTRINRIDATTSRIETVDPTDHTVQQGRVVENLLSYSEDFSNAAWIKTTGVTASGSNVQYDGSGSAGWRLYQSFPVVTKKIAGVIVSGSGNFRLYTNFGDILDIVATAEPVFYSMSTSLSDGSNGNIGVYTTSNGSLNLNMQFMLYDVTGLPASYVPEYVPNIGVGTARKIFNTTSGNTVSGNVVTEAAGIPLHPTAKLGGAPINRSIATRDSRMNSAVVAVGDEINVNGQHLRCVQAGTLGASVPAASAMPAVGSPELVVNGGFDSTAGWVVGSYASITDGVCSVNTAGAQGLLQQPSLAPTVGSSYAISRRNISGHPATRPTFGGQYGTYDGTLGVIVDVITATTTSTLIIFSGGTPISGVFDDLSVKEVLLDGTAAFISVGLYQPDYGVLLEGTGTNRLTYSEDFTNAAWTTSSSGTVTSNTTISPDGLSTADTFVGNGITGQQGVRRIVSTAAGDTISFFVSPALSQFVQIFTDGAGSAYVNYDIINGVVGSVGAGISSYGIDDVGMGFYRIYITPSVVSSGFRVISVSSNTAPRAEVYLSPNSFNLWGAQLESGALTSYMKSVATNGTRADSMGAIKWSTVVPAFAGNGFPHARGNMFLTIVPQYASGDLPTANRSIVTLSNVDPSILFSQLVSVTNFKTTDSNGATGAVITIPAWLRNDAIQFNVRWGLGADPTQPTSVRLQLSYRMASAGGTWVHVASVPYDGAFNDTGFLQLLKALGLNNTVFQQLPMIHDTPMTNAALDAIV